MSLDLPDGELSGHLQRVAGMLERFYASLPERPIFHGRSPGDVRRRVDEPLPAAATPLDDVLARVERDVLGSTTLSASGRFFGYVVSGGSQAGILADLLAGGYGICGGKWLVSAAHTEIEALAVRWIAEFVGLPPGWEGVLTSGGSEANLSALVVARAALFPEARSAGLSGSAPLVVYTSSEGHSSLQKAAEVTGIGSRQLRRVGVDGLQRMRPDALEAAIAADLERGLRPLCVVATAGTTNTGAVDPLPALAEISRRHGLWLHVDGAYGAPAAAVDSTAPLFEGLALADSLTVDPHKWLYVPFEAGSLLVRHPGALRRAFSIVPPYLDDADAVDRPWDLHEHGLQLTRSFRGLKVWMTFLVYGADAIRRSIESNLSNAARLVRAIEAAPDWELAAAAPLSVVCFRYVPTDERLDPDQLDRLQLRLAARARIAGEVFLATTRHGDRTVLRVCIVNHRTCAADVDRLLPHLRRLAGKEKNRGKTVSGASS